MLAPLTNTQSHDDGVLSDDEFNWLTMRAKGGFGLTMSCASHVQAVGKGFRGQLGIFGDEHIEGLKRLTDAIKSHESLAVAQLHHAGMRSPEDIIGEQPVCPDIGPGGRQSPSASFNWRSLALSQRDRCCQHAPAAQSVRAFLVTEIQRFGSGVSV